MDGLAEKLEVNLRTRKPDTAAQVRQRFGGLIDLADDDVMNLMHSPFGGNHLPVAALAARTAVLLFALELNRLSCS